MKSAGNDIVALNLVDKQRTCEPRFFSKILSASEQALYHQPEIARMAFENYVWLLWSVKESAYKYLKRTDPGLLFSPTKFIIENIRVPASNDIAADLQMADSAPDEVSYGGTVNDGSYTLFFRSKITSDWISTVVNSDNNFENVCCGVQSIDETGYYAQSAAAKALLLKKISAFFPGDLKIQKSDVGYPILLHGAKDLHIPASLAHHGRFVSYAFLLNSPALAS